MTLLDRHGFGVMRFSPITFSGISDDEARLLTLFAAGRKQDRQIGSIAANLVEEEMGSQLAGATWKIGDVMRQAGLAGSE